MRLGAETESEIGNYSTKKIKKLLFSACFSNVSCIKVLYVGILGYYLPLAIMLMAYVRIFYVMKRRLGKITQNKKVEVVTVIRNFFHG